MKRTKSIVPVTPFDIGFGYYQGSAVANQTPTRVSLEFRVVM